MSAQTRQATRATPHHPASPNFFIKCAGASVFAGPAQNTHHFARHTRNAATRLLHIGRSLTFPEKRHSSRACDPSENRGSAKDTRRNMKA